MDVVSRKVKENGNGEHEFC